LIIDDELRANSAPIGKLGFPSSVFAGVHKDALNLFEVVEVQLGRPELVRHVLLA
jgi:hypothetical protein